MIGIDLGVKNLGFYNSKFFRTYNMENDFLEFCEFISSIVFEDICYVDFDWRINYWPGDKKTKTQLIFLAGIIYSSADICTFVQPSEIREMLGFSATVPKKELHRTALVLYPELKEKDSHQIDAYLLYKFGEKQNDIHG